MYHRQLAACMGNTNAAQAWKKALRLQDVAKKNRADAEHWQKQCAEFRSQFYTAQRQDTITQRMLELSAIEIEMLIEERNTAAESAAHWRALAETWGKVAAENKTLLKKMGELYVLTFIGIAILAFADLVTKVIR